MGVTADVIDAEVDMLVVGVAGVIGAESGSSKYNNIPHFFACKT